jgi:sterol 3beta-glucosyltransferase
MLVTFLAIGSRGDVQPHVALGVELQKLGQRARIATFENFASFVASFGLEFYPVHGDVASVAAGQGTRSAMQADNPLKLLFSFNKLKDLAAGLQRDLFDACAGSDAIVYHPGPSIGYFAARELGIPSILATPFPMTPTRAYPSLIFYDKPRLGGRANYATHKVFEQIMWMAGKSPVRQFWQQEFGRPPQDFGCPYSRQTSAAMPTVVSCSNYVFPRPDDWLEHVHNTGYWFLDDAAGWQPPDDLLSFLDRGAPPVYVGFGSIGDPTQAAQTTRLVIEALQAAGQRGVLATGWSGMAQVDGLPDSVFMLDSAPHSWLFPRMAAVVHHGGAGTTAAGLRAGVPNVVIPHSNDQFAWGRRVHEMEAGPTPIPRKKLTAQGLAGAIDSALTPPVRAAAQELGKNIQSERGVETAARIIDGCLAR